MTIIFDFNRTIFDPETNDLMPGAREVLSAYAATGHSLHLVSKKEAGRDDILTALDITGFFESVAFVEDKEEAIRILTQNAVSPVYVVGDHLHNEIRIGNRCGARTVWLKSGRFAGLIAESEHDVPWRTIERLEDVLAHIPD